MEVLRLGVSVIGGPARTLVDTLTTAGSLISSVTSYGSSDATDARYACPTASSKFSSSHFMRQPLSNFLNSSLSSLLVGRLPLCCCQLITSSHELTLSFHWLAARTSSTTQGMWE